MGKIDPGADGDEPKRDFHKMFDLDRTTLIKSFVDRMEQWIPLRARVAA